ncbi:MAG: type V CRISPR-associated endonuclease Cas1 [Alloprevotella sp.]|nr:type V CRISPR-associated endonuclease Cas1 [Alloprevotella sp.]
MFTHKDIEMRTIFVVNCLEHKRVMRVSSGELMLEETVDGTTKTLTKFPFQKILALFVIGHFTLTTPLIDKCKRHGVALVVVKPNLRPVFYWADEAEANYLLRKRQYEYDGRDLQVARAIVRNKIANQAAALQKTRRKDAATVAALAQCREAWEAVPLAHDSTGLMGLEGSVSKAYFAAYFQSMDWQGRHPRMKTDPLNVVLDIGYTLLFNFVECFLRMFGFDLYVGVYHKLWFKRKSLVCDIIEPFRCIVDHTVLLAFNRRQFSEKDFCCIKQEYHLKYERCAAYYQVFFESLIAYKQEIFKYVQSYYRCFMGRKSLPSYPTFSF